MVMLTDNIKNKRRHGDAVRIASIVNESRVKQGRGKISPAYIRSMLNGNRNMTEEVGGVAKRFFEVQEKLTKTVMA